MLKSVIRFAGFLGLLPLCIDTQVSGADAVTEWIRSNAIPLSTAEAGHGFDDMKPLARVVGNARIVALGEATHGTREFFQLKHRILEFLASQMGFTLFAIEANMPEAYRLNDFVLNGNGDPEKLIKGMHFWTWDTQEVLNMVRWIREFNKSGKGRVEFTGFDMQYPQVATDVVREFVFKADPEYAPVLARASEMALAPPLLHLQQFGTATGSFPLELAAGKTIRFSGYIKTENVSEYAGLWWRADGPDKKALTFANLGKAAPKGTTDWKRCELEIAVPTGTVRILFGPLLAGSGTAWFDDLKVEIDGIPYNGDAFDFSFESPKLRGLQPIIPWYPARLDSEVAHSGKQSLRISHVPVPGQANAVDPKEAAAEWMKVFEHLNSSRGRYAVRSTPREIDWAIQNARIVLQCMQTRAHEVSRDSSMAANVKWILDDSPRAKIVLWAHNGHIMTAGGNSMGSALRRIYGDQMVVFGFAFNQGSFRAVAQGGGGLREFTVPPAPAGSMDATLAASGLPIFALDLRDAPKTGPVASWLNSEHGTRSIGAAYPRDSPYAYIFNQVVAQAYDALLFVEKTTASRANSTGR